MQSLVSVHTNPVLTLTIVDYGVQYGFDHTQQRAAGDQKHDAAMHQCM